MKALTVPVTWGLYLETWYLYLKVLFLKPYNSKGTYEIFYITREMEKCFLVHALKVVK